MARPGQPSAMTSRAMVAMAAVAAARTIPMIVSRVRMLLASLQIGAMSVDPIVLAASPMAARPSDPASPGPWPS
jgi:hypothetical protein